MSQILAVDYSFARPSPRLIRSSGYTAVGRYLGGSADKNLTRAEAAALHGAGLGIWLVWEGRADRAAAGSAAGHSDAAAALTDANALGYPKGCPIFFAVDFDANPASVRPYFEGVHQVLGARAGVYGGIRVTEGLRSLIGWRWQTAAWSGGHVDPQAQLYQRTTMVHPIPGCDENVVCYPVPFWSTTKPPVPPVSPKPPVSTGPTRVQNARSLLVEALGLLDAAVTNGRTGAVKTGRDTIRRGLNQLPEK